MARAGISKTKMLIFRETQRVERPFTKLSGANYYGEKFRGSSSGKSDEKSKVEAQTTSSWVPHPRTGIYFPKGHEWVMDDVPATAASFPRTHWFRNVDGVDKPDP
ncbi:uncharacterized protein LOC110806703 isoform X2 [Carica papaya]|uniref:uncharacterized protein LOC110806703 isoform X2 n=1 Tax=Carica papaya TaxID=3649 RepID=UPI000B8D07A5|nr:uncharacterized protein LOC110806703 isoform X2 [Carica papaya]